MRLAFALIAASAIATPSVAQSPSNYIALALADGPTATQRFVLSFRGTNATDVIKTALKACYRRAALGYRHTCQVWYGDAWIVATACQLTPTDIKFGIGDDANSPEAAKLKAIETIRKTEHSNVSNCRVVAEYNASDMKSARSVATDDR